MTLSRPLSDLSDATSADQQRWDELHAIALDRPLTRDEWDERHALWRRLDPGITFAPSSAVMARRFGARNRRDSVRLGKEQS